MKHPMVGILMGSKSDLQLMEPASKLLTELDISHEVRVLSAHRTPERTIEFASRAQREGYQVLICGAGGAAHLAGVVAAHTALPVIGVPLARSPLAGQDALYATVQMPPGIPVATVGIDGAQNAALLAASIIGLSEKKVRKALEARREATTKRVISDDEALQAERRS